MFHHEFGVETVRDLIPPAAIEVLEVITWLGDPAFLVVLVSLVYLLVHREQGAFAIGLGVGALALTVGLKELLMFSRPPAALRLAEASGYGFPSGHALGATVVWGGLALVLDVWTRRKRLLVASAVIVLVALSRVALGVHYPFSAAAGVVIGVVYLTFAGIVTVYRPDRSLVLGVIVAGLAVVVAGASTDAMGVLGGGIGAVAAWMAVRERTPATTSRIDYPVAVFGLVYVAVLDRLAVALGSPMASFVIYLSLTAGVVALPALSREVLKS